MSQQPTVYIADLPRAEVLAALYNATAPGGMGFLQAGHGPKVMTIENAAEILESSQMHFDYVYGRCLKIDLSQGDSFDPYGFDRDNGQGAAQKVIDRLRATHDVNPQESQEEHEAAVHINAHQTMEFANTSSSFDDSVFILGGDDVAASLQKAVDNELNRIED